MPHVNNDGLRISYRTCGKGEPLVLIHGWSGEGRYWDECGYVDALRAAFESVIPDLRGHGESDTPATGEFNDGTFASDVIAVLDHLGLDSAHVFGYSLGGWVVFELAAGYPSRVRTAIVGGAHPYDEDLSALRGLRPADILNMWESLGVPLSEKSKRRLARFDPSVLAATIGPDREDKADRLRGLSTPFLLLCGTADWRFDGMRRLARELQRCEFIALEGVDHIQGYLERDRLVSALRELFALASWKMANMPLQPPSGAVDASWTTAILCAARG